MIVQVEWKGYEKLAFFDQHLTLFQKRYTNQAISISVSEAT